MLTRLRQLALHPGLVPANYLEQLRASAESDDDAVQAPVIRLTPEDKIRLQGLLAQAIEDSEECPICFDILENPRITSCSHAFCLAWFVFPFSDLTTLFFFINDLSASLKSSPETLNVQW